MDEYCRCGRQAVQRTTWTESNADGRFVGCVRGRSINSRLITITHKPSHLTNNVQLPSLKHNQIFKSKDEMM